MPNSGTDTQQCENCGERRWPFEACTHCGHKHWEVSA